MKKDVNTEMDTNAITASRRVKRHQAAQHVFMVNIKPKARMPAVM